MKSDYNALIAAAIVVVLFGGSLAVCFYPCDEQDETFTVTGEVTGLSPYNQPKLDIKAEELYDNGALLGSTFTVTTDNETYHDAVLLKGYMGMFMFDIFVNVESDGFISIGCVGMLIYADTGSEVTLTHTGESERYASTPLYNGGDTDKRSDYPSDAVFANFYEVTGGDIAPGVLYRSFSPLNNPQKAQRSAYVDALAEEAGIQFEIALSYTEDMIRSALDMIHGYCADLCKNGNYVAPGMGYLYFQQKEKTTEVLRAIIDNNGPYLIHCNVGRDRTGYTVLLLQALCGCTAEEMRECEARAFCNLYHIEPDSKEYRAVVGCTYDRNMYLIANPDRIPDILEIDWTSIDVSSVDTYAAAYSYCTDYLGLTADEVSQLQERLCGRGPLNIKPGQRWHAHVRREDHRRQEGMPSRPDGPLREPHPARLRHRGGPGIHLRRRAEAGGALRERLGIHGVFREGARQRWRELLRRVDEGPPLGDDILQRRVQARQLLPGSNNRAIFQKRKGFGAAGRAGGLMLRSRRTP